MLWRERGHDVVLGKDCIVGASQLEGRSKAGLEALNGCSELWILFDRSTGNGMSAFLLSLGGPGRLRQRGGCESQCGGDCEIHFESADAKEGGNE